MEYDHLTVEHGKVFINGTEIKNVTYLNTESKPNEVTEVTLKFISKFLF